MAQRKKEFTPSGLLIAKDIKLKQTCSIPHRKYKFPAERVRCAAGYSLDDAAKKLRLHPRYLRHIERHGGASLHLARRLAHLYGCDGNIFIFSPEYLGQLGQEAAAEPFMPPVAAGADTIKNSRSDNARRTLNSASRHLSKQRCSSKQPLQMLHCK